MKRRSVNIGSTNPQMTTAIITASMNQNSLVLRIEMVVISLISWSLNQGLHCNSNASIVARSRYWQLLRARVDTVLVS
jgi:hypothetical protein